MSLLQLINIQLWLINIYIVCIFFQKNAKRSCLGGKREQPTGRDPPCGKPREKEKVYITSRNFYQSLFFLVEL
jgi:hypothetical protein